MPGILFPIKDALIELESAKAVAGEFLENEELVFAQMRTQLEGLRDERTGHLSWRILPSQPLRTVVSDGEYDRGRGGRAVRGTLSFLWEIGRVRPKRKTNDEREREWERKRVREEKRERCHFHVQIRGEEEDGPFPRTLSVPRLPSCLATPMAVLEFMLAELFQERWKRHVFSETDPLKRWRAIQRKRFSKLLDWQRREVSSADRSPWSALKSAKPPQDIFLD